MSRESENIRDHRARYATPPELRIERAKLNTVEPVYAQDIPNKNQHERQQIYSKDRVDKHRQVKSGAQLPGNYSALYQGYSEATVAHRESLESYNKLKKEERKKMKSKYNPHEIRVYNEERDGFDSKAHMRLEAKAAEVYEKAKPYVFMVGQAVYNRTNRDYRHVQMRNEFLLGKEDSRHFYPPEAQRNPGRRSESLSSTSWQGRNRHFIASDYAIRNAKRDAEKLDMHRRHIREDSPSLEELAPPQLEGRRRKSSISASHQPGVRDRNRSAIRMSANASPSRGEAEFLSSRTSMLEPESHRDPSRRSRSPEDEPGDRHYRARSPLSTNTRPRAPSVNNRGEKYGPSSYTSRYQPPSSSGLSSLTKSYSRDRSTEYSTYTHSRPLDRPSTSSYHSTSPSHRSEQPSTASHVLSSDSRPAISFKFGSSAESRSKKDRR